MSFILIGLIICLNKIDNDMSKVTALSFNISTLIIMFMCIKSLQSRFNFKFLLTQFTFLII